MQCVFEGIVKKLGELWFDTKYASENFNVSNLIDIIDSKHCSKNLHILLHDIQDLLSGTSHIGKRRHKTIGFFISLYEC